MDDAVGHRIGHRAQELGGPMDGRHHRVLERALPALDGDRLGDPAEHHRQVVPEDRPDDQGQEQAGIAGLGADQRDREGARGRVDQERDLPAPVAPGQEEVSFDEGVRGLQFMGQERHRTCLSRLSLARPLSGTGQGEGSAPLRAAHQAGSAGEPRGGGAVDGGGAGPDRPGAPPRRGGVRERSDRSRAAAGCRRCGTFDVSFRQSALSAGSSASSSTSSSRDRPV